MNININKFIENNTHIDKDEKAIVKFGIDMMISTIMAFITARNVKRRYRISNFNYCVETICWRLSYE